MKHLLDIYEEGEIVSTPSNTLGMGNPMPAGVNGDTGTEPLPDKKKKKSKKAIKEGVLSDMNNTFKNEGELLKFAEWLADNNESVSARDNLVSDLLSGITTDSKGNFTIDCKDIKLDSWNQFDLFIPKEGVPSWIKSIKILNAKVGVQVFSYCGDLSNFTLETYRDNCKSYADVSLRFKIRDANKSIKLCKLACMDLYIGHPTMETLNINDDSTIITLRLEDCKKLNNIYGSLQKLSLYKVNLPRRLVQTLLKQTGIISWSSEINIF